MLYARMLFVEHIWMLIPAARFSQPARGVFHGASGTGKTTLMNKLASHAREALGFRVFWLNVAAYDSADLLLVALAVACSQREVRLARLPGTWHCG